MHGENHVVEQGRLQWRSCEIRVFVAVLVVVVIVRLKRHRFEECECGGGVLLGILFSIRNFSEGESLFLCVVVFSAFLNHKID